MFNVWRSADLERDMQAVATDDMGTADAWSQTDPPRKLASMAAVLSVPMRSQTQTSRFRASMSSISHPSSEPTSVERPADTDHEKRTQIDEFDTHRQWQIWEVWAGVAVAKN